MKPAEFTATGLPKLREGELELCLTEGATIEDDSKSAGGMKNGVARVTSHRILWSSSLGAHSGLELPLRLVTGVESKVWQIVGKLDFFISH